MATRRRGRALESAIFAAVWDELRSVGYADLQMGRVADRAGTSKPVLYRRWPRRADLVVGALRDRLPDAREAPDTGNLRSDVIELLTSVTSGYAEIETATLWGLLAEAAREPDLLSSVRTLLSIVDEGGPMRVVLERAVVRGEIKAVPPALVVSLPVDLVRNQLLLTGTVSAQQIAETVDTAFLPLLPRPAG
ncbi:TetR/AcrR family transcriptional regulator [Promicromonospora sp. NPDC090134]|uniref:TetR/AcrR family transcriptional regulator n=1 Tax=Promicromonospora sp. NPDC090134 TaxID=3364408 RepID=UPI003829F815